MNVGLPGTGIGGIFYLVLALWMPFKLLFSRQGLRSASAVATALRSSLLVAAIVAAVWIEVRGLSWLFSLLNSYAPSSFSFPRAASDSLKMNGWNILLANLVTLLVVYAVVRLLARKTGEKAV